MTFPFENQMTEIISNATTNKTVIAVEPPMYSIFTPKVFTFCSLTTPISFCEFMNCLCSFVAEIDVFLVTRNGT